MKATISCLLVVAMLGGCGFEEAYRRNEDRYMQPGALDAPLTGYYDVYSFKFLDKYRVMHDWPVVSNCEYNKLAALGKKQDRYKGEIFAVDDIYEINDSTKQRDADPTWNFDRFVRSVKYISKERGREGEVMEIGFEALCFESWWVPSHFFRYKLHKRDLASWREIRTEKTPKGKWSERRVGANLWLVQEMAEQDFSPRPLNGVGGPFQIWLLPIGDTGYTIGMELGASQESLQYPDAHARLQAVFRHLIESVKIEPLTPTIEAEQEQLKAQADEVQRQDCIEMAKRTKPYTWCQKYLNR